MTTDLATLDYLANVPAALGSDDDFLTLSKSVDYLGRLQLFTKGKAINRNLVRPGHYGIPESADDVIDLGDSIDIIAFDRKPKAVDMSDREAIVVSYDLKAPEFAAIVAKSVGTDTGCMYGPSFLVFERSTGRFLEFFCGSKSTRLEAKKLFPFLPVTEKDIAEKPQLVGTEPHGALPVTLKVKLLERGTFSWHAPVIQRCSVPFDNLPNSEVIAREITKFRTIKSDGVEKVAGGEKRRAR